MDTSARGTWDGSAAEWLYRPVRRQLGRFKGVPLDERFRTAYLRGQGVCGHDRAGPTLRDWTGR